MDRLKCLLSERFGLTAHMTTRDTTVYDLVVAKKGPKFRRSDGSQPLMVRRGLIQSKGIPMATLVNQIAHELDYMLFDKTGLDGFYEITLKWTPDGDPSDDDSAPPLLTALHEQLGLSIRTDKAPVSTLVVDHVSRPSPN
jgi:uncharacterized protein (TIGR03435 family)